MTAASIEALGQRALERLQALAAITSVPGEITRLYLSPEYRTATDLVARWMRDAGLDVHEDALATVRGHLPATAPGGSNRRLLIASHIDTVINAGAYDGCLGVVAGLIVAEEIKARGLQVPFGIEVVSFGDEEGVRFPTTLSSSMALAGRFDAASLDKPGRDGITLREALVGFGKDPDQIPAAAIDPAGLVGYVELHIEQGPVLEHEREALGVVTAIAGQCRMRITITGEAGHAGTVPMGLRKDALMAASELAQTIERIARAGSEAHAMVATIGTFAIRPGAVNVVPAEVSFTLDLRANADAPRLAAAADIKAALAEIAARRGVLWRWEVFLDQPTTPMAPAFQDLLGAAAASLGARGLRLASGAGHDAIALAPVTETAMLFVRSRAGLSHHPDEFTSVADMGLAIEALIRFIEALGRREVGPAAA